jgi:hypothetical protein
MSTPDMSAMWIHMQNQRDLADALLEAPKKNKYSREIKPGVHVDVYDALKAWDVRNPALQHLIKKALQAGNRGHKDLMEDLQDILDSAKRAIELEMKDETN